MDKDPVIALITNTTVSFLDRMLPGKTPPIISITKKRGNPGIWLEEPCTQLLVNPKKLWDVISPGKEKTPGKISYGELTTMYLVVLPYVRMYYVKKLPMPRMSLLTGPDVLPILSVREKALHEFAKTSLGLLPQIYSGDSLRYEIDAILASCLASLIWIYSLERYVPMEQVIHTLAIRRHELHTVSWDASNEPRYH